MQCSRFLNLEHPKNIADPWRTWFELPGFVANTTILDHLRLDACAGANRRRGGTADAQADYLCKRSALLSPCCSRSSELISYCFLTFETTAWAFSPGEETVPFVWAEIFGWVRNTDTLFCMGFLGDGENIYGQAKCPWQFQGHCNHCSWPWQIDDDPVSPTSVAHRSNHYLFSKKRPIREAEVKWKQHTHTRTLVSVLNSIQIHIKGDRIWQCNNRLACG